jgi:hypothetical protein
LEQSTLYVSYYSINLNQKFMLHVNEIFYWNNHLPLRASLC